MSNKTQRNKVEQPKAAKDKTAPTTRRKAAEEDEKSRGFQSDADVKAKKSAEEAGILVEALERAALDDAAYSGSMEFLVEPLFDRGLGAANNVALSYGAGFLGGDLRLSNILGGIGSAANILNDLMKEFLQDASVNGEVCKFPLPEVIVEDSDTDVNKQDDKSIFSYCATKSSLYREFEGNTGLEVLSNVFSIISELSKPADPSECINPYFDQFFNLVPFHFIISAHIRKLIKEQLGELTTQEIEETLRGVEPCGQELAVAYKTNAPDFSMDIFPLFKLPPIPTIPNINLYTVFHKLLVELVCYMVCVVMTALMAQISKMMLELIEGASKEDLVGGSGNFTELIGNALDDLNLNEEITDDILTQAILQNKVGGYVKAQRLALGDPPTGAVLDRNGFYRQPTDQEKELALKSVISAIRKYFDSIMAYESDSYKKQVFVPKTGKYTIVEATRKLGTKELIYMMFGEYTCLTMADLIRVGTEQSFVVGQDGKRLNIHFEELSLNSEKRIVEFFKFLGIDFDPIATINKLKKKDCPPLPCEGADEELINDVNARLAELCKMLNFKSGLPPIPINKILSSIGLGDLFNDGIKEQFKQLKTEQLLYLGYPSVINYPTLSDLNPFPPPENNNLDDYELWTEQEVSDEKVFKEFLLRGGPPLQWKYDQYNLNEDLQGSTLEDVCGEEETFEETFIHIFNDVFELDYAKIQETTQQKQKDYKKQYEERVEFEYDRRALTETDSTETEQNPCCKFKDFNYTVGVTGLIDKDIITLGPAPENDPPGYQTLRSKLHDLWNATRGKTIGTDKKKVYNIIKKMTRGEKCYVCRRRAFAGGNSILKDIENDMNKNQRNIVYGHLNCKQFGYSNKRGSVKKHTKEPDSFIDLLVQNKCPKD